MIPEYSPLLSGIPQMQALSLACQWKFIPLFTSLLLFGSYLVGFVAYSLFRLPKTEESFLFVFEKTFLGFILLIFLYALFITNGITILWGFVIIGLMYFYLRRQSDKRTDIDLSVMDKKYLLPLLLIQLFALLLFMMQGFLYYNTPYNNIPHGDYSFYSIIVEGYTRYGIETRDTIVDVVNTQFYGPGMYHHFELWLASVYYQALDIMSIEAQITGVYPFLGAMLCCGLIALSRSITKIKIVNFTAPLFVFFSGLPLWEILPQTETFVFGLGENNKNLILALFLLYAFILMFKGSRLFFLPLVALPIVNIVTLPAIFGALVLTGVAGGFFGVIKCDSRRLIIFWPIAIALFIFSFYFLSGIVFPEKPFTEFTLAQLLNGIRSYPQRVFLIIGGALAILISLYAIHMLLILAIFRLAGPMRQDKRLLFLTIFVLAICTTGLITWSLTNILKDSVQFFSMPAIISMNLFFFVLFSFLAEKLGSGHKKVRNFFIASVLLLLAGNLGSLKKNNEFLSFRKISEYRSLEYLNRVNSELTKSDGVLVAYLANPIRFSNYWQAIAYHQPPTYIKSLKSGVRQVSLSTLDISEDIFEYQAKATVLREKMNAPFTRFVSELKVNNEFKSVEDAQAMFIKTYNVDFIMIADGVKTSDAVNKLISSVYVDSKSGERFARIKKFS